MKALDFLSVLVPNRDAGIEKSNSGHRCICELSGGARNLIAKEEVIKNSD